MEDRNLRLSRRKFFRQAAAITLAGGLPQTVAASAADSLSVFRARPPKPSNDGRKPLAVITTVYRPLSHADHMAGRFIHGYARDGHLHVPRHFVHSLYVEQMPENDL